MSARPQSPTAATVAAAEAATEKQAANKVTKEPYLPLWTCHFLRLYAQERIDLLDGGDLGLETNGDFEADFERFWVWMLGEDYDMGAESASEGKRNMPLMRVSVRAELKRNTFEMLKENDFFKEHDRRW